MHTLFMRFCLMFVVCPGPRDPPGPFPLVPGPPMFPWSSSGPESKANNISETANTYIHEPSSYGMCTYSGGHDHKIDI